VKDGEVVGFLGPNGAGKTTTMRILSCYLPATGGQVRVAGFDVFSHSLDVRRQVGYLPESVPLYGDMRVIEYLRYRGSLKGMGGSRLRTRIDEVVERCELTDVATRIISRLSRGYAQRVGLADSLVHEPKLLILDEPTIGLDPNQRRHIRSLIRSLAPRQTILLSSHILSEVEMTCDRVLIINRGRIMASDTPANLLGLMKGNPRVAVEVKGPADRVSDVFASIDGVVRVSLEPGREWNRFVCECEKGRDVRTELFRAVIENRWTLRELTEERRNLEDVFAEITAEG
jgi:ABC-2 type transport system ATP-binding protein